ncbi:hypothetical protein HDU86_001957 [Geranomyces michiganensis]|nr:hypothetical protein HDU86_001957 [Geranomyces michiganensis]
MLSLVFRPVVISLICLSCISSFAAALPASNFPRDDKHPVTNELAFGYSGPNGPVTWPGMCKTGKNQSPIELLDSKLLQPPSLANMSYQLKSTALGFKNLGHTVQVDFQSASRMGFNALCGTQFDLKQLHFHMPSEHRKKGQMSVMEMHMVHKSTEGEIAVVGVLFELGEFDATQTKKSFLSPLTAALRAIRSANSATVVNTFKFEALLPILRKSKNWIYMGSLTTPPCTENVRWYVMDTTMAISPAEFNAFKEIIKFNSRPVMSNENAGTDEL